MILLFFFAFLAGVVTILSPCILPILPIVLSGSVGEGRRRPLGIVLGFAFSFTFFTLALASLVKATGIPADTVRNIAVVAVFLMGIFLLLPQTAVWLEQVFSVISSKMPVSRGRTGFLGGLGFGLTLGLVWTPCVGPILASVIALAAASQVNFAAVAITVSYSLGSALPMLAITYGGRQLLQKVPWLLKNTGRIQQAFGVVMIVVAIGLFFNLDRQFQNYILQKFPQYGAGLTIFEQNETVAGALQGLHGGNFGSAKPVTLDQKGVAAPDFTGGTAWINSSPLSLKKELKGKVVLVDFWTYSCVNCIRTFPYLRKWYDTYKDQGFVIVGVHSPEFEFEKVTENVKKAAADFQLMYPIVQDNNFAIWTAYSNQFWPAHYLIDQNGDVRYTHFGEGNYVETENAIRQLLNQPPINQAEAQPSSRRLTPETYLGWGRADAYVNDNQIQNDQSAEYTFSGGLPDDAVGLKGTWVVNKEYIQSQKDDDTLSLNFVGNQVFLVMDKAPKASQSVVNVVMDGQPLPQKYWTKDMNATGQIILTGPRKYDVVDLKGEYGRHTIELRFPNGAMVFAFTFG